MELNDIQKEWARTSLGAESQGKIFTDIVNDKITELTNASTFGHFEHEKDLEIQVIYAGRMSAARAFKEFAETLLRAALAARQDRADQNKAPDQKPATGI